jgi:hypothetical protein
MNKGFLYLLIILIGINNANSQTIYVDSDNGKDLNVGSIHSPVASIQKALSMIKNSNFDLATIKVNSGVYVLDSHLSISSFMGRIVLEASILPDDSLWKPESMPIILSTAKKGEIEEDKNFVVGFLIEKSNVEIRGVKFLGYQYPNTRYYPIARFSKKYKDLHVEQCVFVGDDDASHIQAGVITHGDSVKINNCVFHKVRNTVVFYEDSENGIKHGNSLTNCIINGTSQSAIWTAWPDTGFVFKNNIVTNCNYVWMKNSFNKTEYSMENCVLVNNRNFQGDESRQPTQFKLNEINIIKSGNIQIRKKEEKVDLPLPKDYLHIIPNTLGYNLRAGLFKK